MLEHVLMLESLHRACGCLLIPNFRASLVLPEHQSLAKHCSADEEIRKGQYMAGNGLGFFRGVNVWTGEMIGNYEQYGTWASSRINLYLTAYSLVSISSAPSTVSPMGRNMRGCPGWEGPAAHLLLFLPLWVCCQVVLGSDPAPTLETVCSVVSNSSSYLLPKHMGNQSFCPILWGQIPKQKSARELRHTHTPTNASECQSKSRNK